MSGFVTSFLWMSNFTFLFISASFYSFCVFSSDLQEAKVILMDLPFPFEMSLLHAKERGFYVLTKQSKMQSSKTFISP